MSILAIATIVSVFAAVALWGWGWLTLRLVRISEYPLVLTMAVGLPAVLFLGGVLNVAHLATKSGIDAVVAVGIVLAVVGRREFFRGTRELFSRENLGPGLLLPLTAWFLASSLLPQSAYNHHDDFEKYFAHPVAMLATGTLGPNPLDSLGAETLGGQAFLQAGVAAHFPLAYLGAMDGVFCLLLGLALVSLGVPSGRWALGALAAGLCYLSIEPQVANTSSVFSSVCLIASAVLIVGRPDSDAPRAAPLLALVYAGLLSLKGTLAIFVVLHFASIAATSLMLGRVRLRWMLLVVAWTLMFVLPWLVLHAPLYLATPLPAPELAPAAAASPINLFSTWPQSWGVTQIDYTGLALAGGTIGFLLLAAARLRRWPVTPPLISAAAAGFTACACYLLLVRVIGPAIAPHPSSTRYACPILIGTLPACMRLLENVAPKPATFRFVLLGLLGFAGAVLLTFLPATARSIDRLARLHAPLIFLGSDTPEQRFASQVHLEYCHAVLDGHVRSHLASLQAKVPPGEKIIAWTTAPFLLDFERNPILHANLAGLGMRWARPPADARYVLIEHHGHAVRTRESLIQNQSSPILTDRVVSTRSLNFLHLIDSWTAQGRILHRDDAYILLSLQP